jgi:hypothetical protein
MNAAENPVAAAVLPTIVRQPEAGHAGRAAQLNTADDGAGDLGAQFTESVTADSSGGWPALFLVLLAVALIAARTLMVAATGNRDSGARSFRRRRPLQRSQWMIDPCDVPAGADRNRRGTNRIIQ